MTCANIYEDLFLFILSKCANAREHVRAFASLVAAKHVKRKQPNPFAYSVVCGMGNRVNNFLARRAR